MSLCTNALRKQQNNRSIWKEVVILCGFILMFQISAVGVFAWLNDMSGPVENIFSSGKVNIDIEETDTGDGDENRFTNTYEIKPGEDISKDPKVTIPANSSDCWMFIKVEQSENFNDYMQYEIDNRWTKLGDGSPGVYYKDVYSSEEDQTFPVISKNTVKVKASVTKEILNSLENEPTLKITAYAIQQASLFTPQDAWEQLQVK